MSFYRQTNGGIEIRVRVIPNAKQEGIMGVELRDDGNEYLKIKTRAIPEDGKANDSIIKILAKALKTSKSNITLLGGATNRTKTFLIKDITPGEIEELVQN
jgi:uncharacterized protein (TIGR00251 family)